MTYHPVLHHREQLVKKGVLKEIRNLSHLMRSAISSSRYANIITATARFSLLGLDTSTSIPYYDYVQHFL